MRNFFFDFFVTHFCQFGRCQYNVIIRCKQACIFCDSNSSFFSVARNHNDLYACIMHICNSCNGFRSYFVTDSDNAYQSPIAFGERVTCKGCIGSCDCKHTDSSVSEFINFFIKNFVVKLCFIALFIIVIFTILNEFFGCTLNESYILITLDSGCTVLVCGVERYGINRFYIGILVLSVCNELQNSSFCGISADYFQSVARTRYNCICIVFECKCKHFTGFTLYFFKTLGFFARAVKEVDSFKFTFCDSTCLIAEKNVKAACCFDTAYFTDKHVVIQHFLHVHGGNNSYHQRQAFGDCHNDDNDCKHESMEEVRKYSDKQIGICKIGTYAAVKEEHGLYHIGESDSHTADIAELAYCICQFSQFHLQGRFSVVINLKFLCDLTVNGLVTYDCNFHYGITRTYNSTSEYFVFIKEIEVFTVIRLVVFGNGNFFSFLAFTVENRLVNREVSVNDNTIGRNFVTALEENAVTHNYVIDSDFGNFAVAVNFTFDKRSFFLEFLESVFIVVLRESGNKSCNKYGCGNTDSFIPFRVADTCKLVQQPENNIQHQGNQENFNHGVSEVFKEFLPESFPCLFGKSVVAVFFFRLGDLFVSESKGLHFLISHL